MTFVPYTLSVGGKALRVLLKLIWLSIALGILLQLGGLLLFFVSVDLLAPASEGIVVPFHPKDADADGVKTYEDLRRQYWKLNRARDRQNAVFILQQCMRIETAQWHRRSFCKIAYAKAVLRGDGVHPDEAEAFRLLAEVERSSPGVGWEELSGQLEKTVGINPDRVLAAVFAWHEDHGSSFGICESDDDCGAADVQDLVRRINARLTPHERDLAEKVEQIKYPRTIRQYQKFYVLRAFIFVALALVFFAICRATLASRKKRDVLA